MQEITPLALDLEVTRSNTPTLGLPIVRLVLFARELPLCSFESVAFLSKVELFDRCAVCIVCILQNAHVDADHLVSVDIL